MKSELVISGFAGRFANCDNLDELAINLYDNKDCITEDDLRWPKGIFGLPFRSGKIKHLGHFDREYFGISEQDANCMDPQMRILLELTFEAFCDSGNNPDDIRGQNIGVFVASDISETEHANFNNKRISKATLPGTHKALFANRMSFHFDLRGPSYTINNACSGSAMALHQAVLNIEAGQCDAALVAGCHITLNPLYAVSLKELKILSPDGKSKFLDESANGYVRSESCSVMYIQKKSKAKRIYAKIINVKTNCDGYRYPPNRPLFEAQAQLIINTLGEVKVDPNDVLYVEAHGTGTYKGDQCEVLAIDKALCQGRKERLQIGSVKTNIGHCEPAAALCSIAKVILTFENGIIPASKLISDTYNNSISDIIKSKLDPVKENRVFTDGIVAINSVGLGGSNLVILLGLDNPLQNEKKNFSNSVLPLILPLFSRTEQGIIDLSNYFEKHHDKISIDLAKLFYEICNVKNMNYHGFFIKSPDAIENNFVSKPFSKISKTELVFVFPGLSHNGEFIDLITRLSHFQDFQKSLEKSENILDELGLDLDGLYIHDNLSNNIICHVIVQIAIVDLMYGFNVKTKNNLAFSLGKIACAYANSMIDHNDALSLAVSISDYFEKNTNNLRAVEFISKEELQEINEIISENLHLHFLTAFSIHQINPCNFSLFEHEHIINYLSSFYYNTDKCKLGSHKNENNFTENYVVLEIAMISQFDKLSLDDQVKIININKNGDLYHGVLECIGNLFQLNFPINFKNIYSSDEYPVRRGTPSIHSLIKWDHSHDYFVVPFTDFVCH